MSPEKLAEKFHEAFWRLAPEYGVASPTSPVIPWAAVPANTRALLAAVCSEVFKGHVSVQGMNHAVALREIAERVSVPEANDSLDVTKMKGAAIKADLLLLAGQLAEEAATPRQP